MTALTNKTSSSSTAIVSYRSPLTRSHVQTALEAATNEVFRRSLEIAKFELEYLNPYIAPNDRIAFKDRRLSHVLQPLPGPYSVGRLSFVLDVPESSYSISGGDKKIGIEIYAPTHNSDRPKLPMRLGPILETYYKKELGLHEEQLQTLETHSLEGLDPIGKNRRLIIFSHGLCTESTEYAPLIEKLVSLGYVVMSLAHESTSFRHSIDWDIFSKKTEAEQDLAIDQLSMTQAANIQFVIDKIQNEELKEIPKDLCLTDKIVLAGHSLGGAASIIVSRNNPQIAGCINLDGGLWGRVGGLTMPVLTLTSDVEKNGSAQRVIQDWKSFHKNSAHSKYEEIEGTEHMDFGVFPSLAWLGGAVSWESVDISLKATEVTSQKIVEFIKDIFETVA